LRLRDIPLRGDVPEVSRQAQDGGDAEILHHGWVSQQGPTRRGVLHLLLAIPSGPIREDEGGHAMKCAHANKVIDGFYRVGGKRIGVGWTCLYGPCGTSGIIDMEKADHTQISQAYLAEEALRPESPEMMMPSNR
jgi:hypothetical protein